MRTRLARCAAAALLLGALACVDSQEPMGPGTQARFARGGPPAAEASNNLSYPVLWAEGVTKTLPGTPGMTPLLTGTWWYQWGTNGVDPDIVPASCPPDPDESNIELNPAGLPLCDDGIAQMVNLEAVAGTPTADNPLPLARAYLQKDPKNVWQAGSADVSATPLHVNWIDWGDNLESQNWYLTSQVRTEVVLFQDLAMPMTEYLMRHTSGWGIDEVHGLEATVPAAPGDAAVAQLGPGTRATVYSHCARLTIQKLLVDRADAQLADLVWVPTLGWTEPESAVSPLVNDPIYNASAASGAYTAEINVKGRIVYGYTWNVRRLNEGPADYRMTFSLDATCGGRSLNTFLDLAQILVPLETEAVIEAEPVGGGAVAVLRPDLNLTYIDVRILPRTGGGGQGK